MSDESKLQQIQSSKHSHSLSLSSYSSSNIINNNNDSLHSPESKSRIAQMPSTSENNSWIKMSECDDFIGPKRSKHTMCAYRNSLYVFGGDNGKNMLNDLITYDCTNNSWGRALNGSPPTPRYHHTAVIYQNSMFVFGGYTGDLNSNKNLFNKNDLYEYKFSSGSWSLWNTDSGASPVPRAAHGAVVYDHKLYIFAGYDGNARLNDMWSIQLNNSNSQQKIWTEIEQGGDQPATVCNFPLATSGDSMYLFAGQSGAKTSNLLFKFDFKTGNWSKIASNYLLSGSNTPPERRSGHTMVAHDNILYIYGGVLGNSFFHEIYSFDLESKNWSLTSMNNQMQPSGRSFLSASVQNEHLYVFGGNGDQNARSNEIYRFKLPNQPKSTLKDDFYRFLQKQLFCDLKFLCTEHQVVYAHCAIVSSRSIYCRQLIKINKEKKEKLHQNQDKKVENLPFYIETNDYIEINIENEKSTSVRIVLEFLYTDRIMSLESKETELDTLKLMVDVYNLAYQFMIPRLKKICENLIELSLNCSNVLALLRYTHSLNLFILKDFCMKFLTKDINFNQVIMLTEFEQLETKLMVEIIRLRQNQIKILSNNKDESNMNEEFSSLEEDMELFIQKEIGNDFSDILIMLDENTPPILAHRCILAARCSYFEAFFRSFMPKERKIIMTIGDTIPPKQACISLLCYIYYDDVSMPPEDALYLFSASHYFQFSNLRLHVFCKQNLEANVSKQNVFDILEAADKIHEKDMKNFALRILRSNFRELAISSRIQELPKDLLIDIIRDVSSIFAKDSQNTTLSKKLSVTSAPNFYGQTSTHLNNDD